MTIRINNMKRSIIRIIFVILLSLNVFAVEHNGQPTETKVETSTDDGSCGFLVFIFIMWLLLKD